MARVCIFAPQTWTYGATLTADSSHASFPVINLAFDQPRKRWQAAEGITDIELNATRSDEKRVAGVGLLYTNIHNPHASWRLRIAHTGEIVSNPWLDTARIFTPGSGAPHIWAIRFVDSTSRIDWEAGGPDLSASFTIEAVIRSWYPGATRNIFKQLTVSNQPVFYIDGEGHLGFFRPGKVNALTTTTIGTSWVHVAVVFDATASEVRLFINGDRQMVFPGVTSPLGGDASTLGEATGAGWDIAEFRGFNIARADADILADAFQPIDTGSPPAGLTTYLPFVEGSGGGITDPVGALGAGQTNSLWIHPNRCWMSPDLVGIDRTHMFWWDDIGGDAGHVRLNIRDELADESAISAGNLLISDAWRPEFNVLEGSTPFGFSDSGTRDTTPNGVTHIVPGAPVDGRQIAFMSRSHDEVYQLWWRLALSVGNSKPLLFCSDPTDPYYAFHRSIFGVFDGPISFAESKGALYRMRAQMRQMA